MKDTLIIIKYEYFIFDISQPTCLYLREWQERYIVMVKNSTNINKTTNHLPPEIIEHKNYHDVSVLLSVSTLLVSTNISSASDKVKTYIIVKGHINKQSTTSLQRFHAMRAFGEILTWSFGFIRTGSYMCDCHMFLVSICDGSHGLTHRAVQRVPSWWIHAWWRSCQDIIWEV